MSNLPEDLKDCEGMKDDVYLFGKWAKIFSSPQLLYQRLMHNMPAHFTEIWVDIQDANKYLRSREYESYGESIGDALVLAVGQVTETNQNIVIDSLDEGYQMFKNWFDRFFIESAKDAYAKVKGVGEAIKEDIQEAYMKI